MGGTICVCERQHDQIGRSILWLPWIITNRVLWSINSAEDKLKRPPSCIETFVEMKHLYSIPISDCYQIAAVISSLQREDWILTNKNGSHFTTRPQEGFFTYTQLFKNLYGTGYKVDSNQSIVATTARTLNFKNLIEILKSKDVKLWEQSQWMFDGEFRFLDGEALGFNKIAFNTFPRSGNSFLRRLLEQVTGITTGATVHLHTSTSL